MRVGREGEVLVVVWEGVELEESRGSEGEGTGSEEGHVCECDMDVGSAAAAGGWAERVLGGCDAGFVGASGRRVWRR